MSGLQEFRNNRAVSCTNTVYLSNGICACIQSEVGSQMSEWSLVAIFYIYLTLHIAIDAWRLESKREGMSIFNGLDSSFGCACSTIASALSAIFTPEYILVGLCCKTFLRVEVFFFLKLGSQGIFISIRWNERVLRLER